MAERDRRFGGNLERANVGKQYSRAFPGGPPGVDVRYENYQRPQQVDYTRNVPRQTGTPNFRSPYGAPGQPSFEDWRQQIDPYPIKRAPLNPNINPRGMRQGIPDALYNKKMPRQGIPDWMDDKKTPSDIGVMEAIDEEMRDPFATPEDWPTMEPFDPFNPPGWVEPEPFDPFNPPGWTEPEPYNPFNNQLGGGLAETEVAQSQWKRPGNMEKTIQTLKLRPQFEGWTEEAIKTWIYNQARANRGGIMRAII